MFHPSSLLYGLVLISAVAKAALTLGSASAFGACAATTITNAGNTVVHGNIGVYPGTSITGFPPGTATVIDVDNTAAKACETDAALAYSACLKLAVTKDLSGTPLNGLTLTKGAYKYDTTASLNGILTLNGQGVSTNQFVFQIGTGLSVSQDSKILLENSAKACNVYFCVGSSATIGQDTFFNGSIIAYTSIALQTGVVDMGGLYALNGAVTLIDDTITAPGTC